MTHIGRFFTDKKAAAPETELNSLTVNQLKDLAAEDGINLGTAKTKAEIIGIISASGE